MCEPVTLTAMQTLALGASVTAGVMGAAGAYQQGQVAKQVGRNNQIMAEYAAQDAQRRAGEDAVKIQQKAAQLKGSQRATMAAKGLDLSEGTAAELLDQTDFFGATDAATARSNGNRDAWSARTQGTNARAQGDAAARQGNLSAFSTLLGTAGSVAGKWYDYGGGGKSPSFTGVGARPY
jgi:hypothetical protein